MSRTKKYGNYLTKVFSQYLQKRGSLKQQMGKKCHMMYNTSTMKNNIVEKLSDLDKQKGIVPEEISNWI